MSLLIPHNKPSLGPNEAEAANRVLESGWVASGREVAAFESDLATFLGTDPSCVVAVSSGSAAIALALLSAPERIELVTLPTYGCSAPVDAVSLAGANALFIDSGADTPFAAWPSSSGTEPGSATLMVDLFGFTANPPPTDGERLICDSAQSLGAMTDGVASCLRGDVGVLSFSPSKIMTVGGYGGAIVSNKPGWIDSARDYLNWDGRTDGHRRFNFALGDVSAAIGRAQLARLPEMLARRRSVIDRYAAAGIPLLRPSDHQGTGYRAIVSTPDSRLTVEALRLQGVGAIEPYTYDEMIGRGIETAPNAQAWARTLVSLPVFPDMCDSDVSSVIEAWERTQ